MASVVRRPNGRMWVQFSWQGKRHTIRLGSVSASQAEHFKRRVEQLVSCSRLGIPSDTEWLHGLSDELHAKLCGAGLVRPRGYSTLEQLLLGWSESRDWSPQTRRLLRPFVRNMRSFFGDCRLSEITEDRAIEFRTWLGEHGGHFGGGLSRATVSRRIRWARQCFSFAVKRSSLSVSPFTGIRGQNEVNRSRDYFVPARVVERLMDAADVQLAGMLALARYGALRCPTEVLLMHSERVNWDNNTLIVRSPKTRRYEGQDQRTIPMCGPLRRRLRELPEGVMFPDYQLSGSTIRSKLHSLCDRCGVPLWNKPWQNMRSTRETEWIANHSIQVVACWMGHSPMVALKHYLQVDKQSAAAEAAREM